MSLTRIAVVMTIAACFSLAAGPSHPQEAKKLYHWVGADGKDHYSDDLPPEALNQARDELSNNSGLAIKRVERALTTDERSAEKAKADAAAAATAIVEKSHQTDQVLLSSYPNEAELARAYKDRLDQQMQTINTIRIELQSQQQSLSALLIAASNLELADKPITEELARKIQISHSQVMDDQRAQVLQLAQAETLRTEAAAQLEHYRSLRSAADAKGKPEASGQASDSSVPPKG